MISEKETKRKEKKITKNLIANIFLVVGVCIILVFIGYVSGFINGFAGGIGTKPIQIHNIAFTFPQECPENKTDSSIIYPYYIYDGLFYPVFLCNLEPYESYSLEVIHNGKILDFHNFTLFNFTSEQTYFWANYELQDNEIIWFNLYDQEYTLLATGITIYAILHWGIE